MTVEIPEGYGPFAEIDGFIARNGPYYVKELEDGSFRYAFQTSEQHGNPNGIVHGGAIFSFVDTAFGHLVVQETGRFCATISITCEYIAGTPVGVLVEAVGRIKKVTRTMVFADMDVMLEDKILMSATCVFKLFGEMPDDMADLKK